MRSWRVRKLSTHTRARKRPSTVQPVIITRPRRVTREDVTGAWRVVAFGCELGPLAAGVPVERWDDVPAVSDDFRNARAAIDARLTRLLDDLTAPR